MTVRPLLLAVAALLATQAAAEPPGNVVRMGTNDSPPYNYWNENGPAGFAVDVANRAAAIAGYRIEWVHVTQSPDEAFRQKVVDLWPFVTIFSQRRKIMFLSETWWRIPTVIYFPESSGIQSIQQLAGRRISVATNQYLLDIPMPSGIHYIHEYSGAAAFQHLCAGTSEAAWLDLRDGHALGLNRPRGCESLRLGSLIPKAGERRFAIAARFGFEEQAIRLRQAIDEMAESGELLAIAERRNILSSADSMLFYWMSSAQARSQTLRFLLWGASIAILVSGFFMLRLRKARMIAEQNAAARSLFLANMSHEVRTPMNGILGMTELALHTDLNQDQRECMEMVHSSARGLLTVLNDILDFSRIDSGRLAVEAIPFDLRAVVERSFHLMAQTGEAKGLAMKLEVSPALAAGFRGDPGRIQQVLLNLIGNAVKFTENGSVTMRVSVAAGGIEFVVEDTGIGIRKEDQARIFEAFTQADSSFTRRFGGTGLGLSIASRLVKLMGGKLEVQSEPDAGSRFHFTLPLEQAALAPTAAPHPESSDGPTRPLRLLVAEDNHVNQVLLTRLLEKAGHQVKIVADGNAALEAIQAERYDAVLMDVHMPVLDGLEATRSLRGQEKSSGEHLPVIALTALALSGDSERCFEAGMDAYLSKPVNSAELLTLLRNIDSYRNGTAARRPA